MGDFLRSAISAIPKTAQSPLALAAYLAAIAAWVLVAFRVNRNKSLLANLQKLPEGDRLAALRLEMVDIPIPDSVTPKDWLRARNQRYYFWGYVALCVVIILLFAMASFTAAREASVFKNSAEDIRNASKSIENANDPLERERSGLDAVQLGVQRQYVVSVLGQPQNETKYKATTCSAYSRRQFKIHLVYDNVAEEVRFFSVTSTDSSFHPQIKNWPYEDKACLGCASFASFAKTSSSSPVYFNYSAKIWVYSERVFESFASGSYTVFLMDRGAGAEYEGFQTGTGAPLEILLGMPQEADTEDYFAKLSDSDQEKFETYRAHTTPNSYSVLSDYEFPEDDSVNYEFKRGGASTCPEQVVWE